MNPVFHEGIPLRRMLRARCVVKVAENPLSRQRAHVLHLRRETGGEGHHIDDTGRLRSFHKPRRRLHRVGQRLGHQDMLVVGHRFQPHRRVQLIGRAYKDGVDLPAAAKLVEVGVQANLARLRQKQREIVHAFLEQIAQCHYLRPRVVCQSETVGPANAPCRQQLRVVFSCRILGFQ